MELVINKDIIYWLRHLCRSYDRVTKVIVSTKNELGSMNPTLSKEEKELYFKRDSLLNGDSRTQGLVQIQGKLSRQMGKYIEYWPIWSEWMKKIDGVGPFVGGNLILKYYYKFVPICSKCDTDLINEDKTFLCPSCNTKSKGEGLLQLRIERRDFPNVSSWISFNGERTTPHCAKCRTRLKENEKTNTFRCLNEKCRKEFPIDDLSKIVMLKPKKIKGVQSNWSSKNRCVSYLLGEQLMRQNNDHLYKQFFIGKRDKLIRTHSHCRPFYIRDMARHQTSKMFLSHFWHVARELEGLSTCGPWIIDHGNHTKIILPFYWDTSEEKMVSN